MNTIRSDFFSHQVYRWHRFYQTGVFGANDVPGLIVFDTPLIIYSLLSSPTKEKGHCRVLVDGWLKDGERDCGRQNFRLYAYTSTIAISTTTGKSLMTLNERLQLTIQKGQPGQDRKGQLNHPPLDTMATHWLWGPSNMKSRRYGRVFGHGRTDGSIEDGVRKQRGLH